MALIPPAFLNTVVALGEQAADGALKSHATGFLYGRPTGDTDENGRKQYQVFLVTNRHVFQKAAERSDTLHARFNRLFETGTNIYPLKLEHFSWTVHPDANADVAVMTINPEWLNSSGVEYFFFQDDDHAVSLEQARAVQVSEGDGVFVLGFPLGESGEERNYAIVRQGIIARIQDWLNGAARTFLIDASIFPGNSGGPVLLKPEIASIRGTKPNDRCALIGMVSSYLPYREVAVSQQTGLPRMIFEENSGLGHVVPHDVIHEAVELAVTKFSSGQSSVPTSQAPAE